MLKKQGSKNKRMSRNKKGAKMTEKIYIYGGGGHGLVCADIARSVGYEEVIFVDKDEKKGIAFSPSLPKYDVFVAIGDNKTRQIVLCEVKKHGFHCVSLIHPSAIISKSAQISPENVAIMPNVVINAFAKVRVGAIVNSTALVEHECEVGDFTHIAVGAKLAGNVRVGAFAMIGAGATIIPNRQICDHAIIGAGAVVARDITENGVFVGVPAKRI